MIYPVNSTFSIKIVETSTGQSRVEIAGDLLMNWGRYLQKMSLLDCLYFGDPAEIMDANTPDITVLDIPSII
jgi:hypothetical protein